ncbi:MAG: fatty acid hydroxylase [Chloroflexi bacterium]|jgi:sterol desaturase/sphingolipid hydroxylase (fatty acid hydroxylase superfamily)|nr:sterol desaturase family protein [Anaerolineaceae bacterium]NMB89279.1 fatty acid hydroxylase [Chloroflexota bacterium]
MEEPLEINHSDIPIRLFKSGFLEFFTHVHPITIIILWTPIIIGSFYWGYSLHPAQGGLLYLPVGFISGMAIWTFVEYNIHRFMFHFCPRAAWQQRIVFLFHGVHHAQPRMKTRLVMPPAVSIPMGIFFFALFNWIIAGLIGQPAWVGPVLSGFSLGYLIYDLMHYATHHFPMRHGVFKYLKRHHMLHHYKTPNQRFGVSTTFWDSVYGTLPKDG